MENFNQAMCDEEMILSRYKDLEWTDDVRGFECARCGRVLIQHYIANCQHKFCSNCHKLMGDGSQRWKCPLCHHFITNIERQDFAFRDQVYQLGVHCPNQKYGCDHTCLLKELKGHMDGCEHTRESALPVLYEGHRSPQMLDELLELRTEVREMKQVMMEMEKRWIDRELERERDVNNRMDEICCKLEIKSNKISADHSEFKNEMSLVAEENKSKILKLDVKSDVLMDMLDMKEKKLQTEILSVKKQIENQDENIKQSIMETELKDKVETKEKIKKLKAKTENLIKEQIEKVVEEMQHSERQFGWKLNEQVLRVNEKMEDNVWRLNVKLTKVEETIEILKTDIGLKENTTTENSTTQLSCFNLVEHNRNFSPDFQWKISGIKAKLALKPFEITSEVFEWAKYPVRAQAKLKVDGYGDAHLALNLKEHNEGEAINLKLIPRVYYVLRDQTATSNRKHICHTQSYLITSTFEYSLNFSASILHKSPLNDPPYNVNDSIAVDIYVEPPKMAKKVHSYNGTLDWVIDNYHKRKEMEKGELLRSHESPYFYTGARGYRVQLRIVLKNKVTASIHFLAGEFDACLPFIFPHQTTITLFNPKNPNCNITKTLQENIATKKWYNIEMCSEKEMESLIENDTLHCKTTIKPSNL